ncbi:MAG: tetratricopeptide repeat protein [Proteobacteria bacterium]|nr:tetratricopeptide repeat protein [Pseudomonadota bacterium]
MTDDNVIHVRFGPSGSSKRRSGARASRGRAKTSDRQARDPAEDLYTAEEVSRLLAVSTSRLRYWDRTGFIRRSASCGRRRYYTFQDLIGIRTAKGLVDHGIPFRDVRRQVESLRAHLPRVARPLSDLRILVDGQALLVRDQGTVFEPSTGQLLLDFDVQALRDDVVRVLRPQRAQREGRHSAYDHYLEGCRLDEDPEAFERAEQAYRRALELDPMLANAYTNLGNLMFRRGMVHKAEDLYMRALKADPNQPEAFYNLGFLQYDRGDFQGAVRNFRRALRCDPAFADARFNLAMALDQLGQREQAQTQWKAYIELDPDSRWAEIARRHLRTPT